MKTILLLLSVLFCANLNAQHANIKISPLAMLEEGNFPAIQAGVEFQLKKRWSLYVEGGVRYRKGIYEYADTVFSKANGFKLKAEVRYYKLSRGYGPTEGPYFAANIFFTNSTHNTGLNYYKSRDSSAPFYDAFSVKKNVLGLNVLVGRQETLGKRFLMDVYAGFGLRLRFINNDHLEYDPDNDDPIRSRHPNINDSRLVTDSKNGVSAAPNVALGFRVCYKL